MLVVLPARNEPDEISLFLINLPMEGVFTKKIDILGRRILGLHNAGVGEVRISAENCLGGLGKGGEILQVGLNKHVLLSSAGYVGNAQTAVNDALEYAKQRHQFGRPIGNFQAIGHMLANMQTEVDASRLLVYFAASRMEQGEDCMQDVSMAKYFASETYVNVSNQGMHIMGGNGYMKEYDMQRYARDARIATTESHSSWYHLNMIAKGLGLKVNS